MLSRASLALGGRVFSIAVLCLERTMRHRSYCYPRYYVHKFPALEYRVDASLSQHEIPPQKKSRGLFAAVSFERTSRLYSVAEFRRAYMSFFQDEEVYSAEFSVTFPRNEKVLLVTTSTTTKKPEWLFCTSKGPSVSTEDPFSPLLRLSKHPVLDRTILHHCAEKYYYYIMVIAFAGRVIPSPISEERTNGRGIKNRATLALCGKTVPKSPKHTFFLHPDWST